MTKKTIDAFNDAVRDSLPNMECDIVSPHRYYCKDEYIKPIELFYSLTNRSSKEFTRIESRSGIKPYKIGSLCSSARLCFLKLAEVEGILFEYHLLNGVSKAKSWEKPSRNDAQLDAFDGETFYECKCQEIFYKKEGLSKSYIPCLKKYFDIDGLSDDGTNIVASLADLHIDLEENINYREACFDVKQLFTHLCAINKEAHRVGKNYTLKYIFFKPNEKIVADCECIKKIYTQLEVEIAAIRNSPIFNCLNNMVGFECEFVAVDSDEMKKRPADLFLEEFKRKY